MQIGDLSVGGAKLHEAIKKLQEAWGETSQHWTDDNARQFCENHLEPIGPRVKAAHDAINRLAEVLARAQRECEW